MDIQYCRIYLFIAWRIALRNKHLLCGVTVNELLLFMMYVHMCLCVTHNTQWLQFRHCILIIVRGPCEVNVDFVFKAFAIVCRVTMTQTNQTAKAGQPMNRDRQNQNASGVDGT